MKLPGPQTHPGPAEVNPEIPPAPIAVHTAPAEDTHLAALGRPVGRIVCFVWKLAAGSWLSMSFLGSIMAVGWASRAARRTALRYWWNARPDRSAAPDFRSFALADASTAELAQWPNWSVAEYRTRHPGSRWHQAFAAFAANLRTGIQILLNTWVLTLPGTLLWTVAWYDGWQNSFNKGYENAAVGPSLFALGTVLFVAAMFYVPLAQARQAVTNQWRAFYDFKLVWSLVRRRWLASLGLSVLCTGLTLPALALKTLPGFFPQIVENQIRDLARAGKPLPPGLRTPDLMSPREHYVRLQRFFLGSAFYVFPAFVVFRLSAARVYAGAIREAVQAGGITEDQLADSEWQALHRLGLTQPRPTVHRPGFVRLMAWLATRTGRITAGVATAAVWLAFVLAVTTSEFFKYTRFGRGWWNQSLIQLPWCDYTPAPLREAAKGP